MIMSCLCQTMAGKDADLSPVCLGDLWIFQGLEQDELAPLTHEDLSFLTGAHRVSITRAMKALKDAGKIILRDKQLILPRLSTA